MFTRSMPRVSAVKITCGRSSKRRKTPSPACSRRQIGMSEFLPKQQQDATIMTIADPARRGSDHPQTLNAGIFDVDGVLLASPHERAWREALHGFAEPDRFTTAMYLAHVAGKPRLSGANAR